MPEADAEIPGGAWATLRGAAAALAREFRAFGLATPELDARLLALHACGLRREDFIAASDAQIDPDTIARIGQYGKRRLAGEPVSRIVGRREFWGRDFIVTPSVLDPRPDTETLVEAALGLLRNDDAPARPARILDLGTGSGCILLTLLAELPQAWGVGADLSGDAIAVARENAARLGVQDRAAFVQADWTAAFRGPFDLVVSNPPYVVAAEIGGLERSVRAFDPLMALDGGEDGLAAYRRIAARWDELVAPHGWLIVEAGAGQAADIAGIFRFSVMRMKPVETRIYRDLAGIDRVVAVRRQIARRERD